MIDWPKELIKDLAKRKCVVFIGSGISCNSQNDTGQRPKSWEKFLEENSENLSCKASIRSLIKKNDYLMACELIKSEMRKQDFITLLKQEYQSPGFKKADIHKDIYDLDARITLSPNFDKIYDTYALNASSNTTSVKNYTDSDIVYHIKRDEPTIVKIHGSIDSPDDLIFSKSDYINARNKHHEFYAVLESLIITHTFLFLGCGLNDPDIQLLLENYSARFHLSSYHYFVLPQRSIKDNILKIQEEVLNLKFLKYNPENSHEELKLSIKNLVKLVNDKRDEIALSQKW